MNANILIPLVEKLENCSTKSELEAVKNEYGKTIMDLAWCEYLGDDLRRRIVAICR